MIKRNLTIVRRTQSGFAHLAIVLVIVIVAAIAGAGYFVYSHSPHQVTVQGTLVASSHECANDGTSGSCRALQLKTKNAKTYNLALSSNLPSGVKPATKDSQDTSSNTSNTTSQVTVTGTTTKANPERITVDHVTPKAPSQSQKLATIEDSGSTNASGWTIVVNTDGSGSYSSSSEIPGATSESQGYKSGTFNAKSLTNALESTNLNSSYTGCIRSASFGTVKTLLWGSEKVTGIDCYMVKYNTSSLTQQLEGVISTVSPQPSHRVGSPL